MSLMPEGLTQDRSAENRAGRVSGKPPLRCSRCGYEIRSYRVLPACPMCRELSWEPAPWRPFTARRDV